MKGLSNLKFLQEDPENSDNGDYSPGKKFSSNMEDSQAGSLMELNDAKDQQLVLR